MKRTMDRDPMNHKCFPMWWREILPAKSKFIIQRLETQLLLLKTLYSFYFLIPVIFHLKIWDYWFDDVLIILIVSKIIFLSKIGKFLFFFTQIIFFYTNFFFLFFCCEIGSCRKATHSRKLSDGYRKWECLEIVMKKY